MSTKNPYYDTRKRNTAKKHEIIIIKKVIKKLTSIIKITKKDSTQKHEITIENCPIKKGYKNRIKKQSK